MVVYVCPQKGYFFISMENKLKKLTKYVKKSTAKLLFMAVASVGLANLSVPAVAFINLDPVFEIDQTEVMELELRFDAYQNKWRSYGQFLKTEIIEPRHSMEIPVTAYSSDVWQTDSTPFITASMTHVRDGVIAANFLKIGTRVRFPELYGDKIFIVEDRMNQRYYYHADIWMSETVDAINFGFKYTTIEIF